MCYKVWVHDPCIPPGYSLASPYVNISAVEFAFLPLCLPHIFNKHRKSSISQPIRRNDMPTVISEEIAKEPTAENPAEEKSTDEQAPTKEEVVKPGEAYVYRAPNQL
jgi:hypothetical protein